MNSFPTTGFSKLLAHRLRSSTVVKRLVAPTVKKKALQILPVQFRVILAL